MSPSAQPKERRGESREEWLHPLRPVSGSARGWRFSESRLCGWDDQLLSGLNLWLDVELCASECAELGLRNLVSVPLSLCWPSERAISDSDLLPVAVLPVDRVRVPGYSLSGNAHEIDRAIANRIRFREAWNDPNERRARRFFPEAEFAPVQFLSQMLNQ